jgi:hypothetical protein
MNTVKKIETNGQRILTEFVCYCEKKYIYIWLNTGINGNYEIVCPTCGHVHYRSIKNGHITDDRYHNGSVHKERIVPTKSAAQATRRAFGAIGRIKQMISGGQAPYGE